jgi:CheY-like chemotaxis protein
MGYGDETEQASSHPPWLARDAGRSTSFAGRDVRAFSSAPVVAVSSDAGPAHILAINNDQAVLDYMWANEDSGWSLLQMLRMDPRIAEIPIVLCTAARREVEEIADHLREMDVRVVLKPFAIDTLLAAVTEGLARAGAGRLKTVEIEPALAPGTAEIVTVSCPV